MKTCMECLYVDQTGLSDPCLKCVPAFPERPEFVFHPKLEDSNCTLYKTGLQGVLR